MNRIRWALSLLAFAIHLGVAARYDFFRDELYFIVCGRHPAFGYLDQPPLIPLLAAASQLFGQNLVLLRAVAALGAFGVVWFTCLIAELAEAEPLGVALAGIAAATAPVFLGLTATLGTSTFEPLAWTALTYFVARAVVRGDARAWLWAGLVAGLALELKYALPLYAVPLLAGLVLTRQKLGRHAVLGLGIAALIALPSAIWQLAHGLPFLELVRASGEKNVAVQPVQFVIGQLLVMNPFYAPLWLLGAAAPFVDRRFKPWRFVSIAFALTSGIMIAMHAKDYYLAPAYGPVLALGATAIDRWLRPRWLKLLPLAPALALSAVAAPLALPILEPDALAAYMRRLHLAPASGEKLSQSDIPQTFADMVGWRSYVKNVGAAYRSLPREQQDHLVILGRNYGESAAIDLYGAAEGLPLSIGRHNQYWLWGPRAAELVLFINWKPEQLTGWCSEARVVGRSSAEHVMPYENNVPITLCTLKQPLREIWPELKLVI
jgi:4-amino-4-deoxy-L-arabinose transferase-like glycosyltransferase